MINTLPLPDYYLESVDIDVSPTVGETVIGVVGSSLELADPTLHEGDNGFECEATLSLQLFVDGHAPWQLDDDESGETFGDVETTFRIHVPGSESELKPHVAEWIETEDYGVVDREFRHHLESGILQYIIDPIGELLENSYNGIIPRIAFTHTAADEESPA